MIEFIIKYQNIILICIIVVLLIKLLINEKNLINNETFINNEEEKKAIVIVEPREHKLLEPIIKNFDEMMDPSWDLYVFYGKSKYDYANKSTSNIIKRNKFLVALDTDNLTADDYNKLFKEANFWNKVNAEHILVFQTDTVLCKNSPYKIEDFMKYNYIGCPYSSSYIGKNVNGYWGPTNYFYGIGGLSYRKKSFMMDCINKNPSIESNFAEDVFFSNCAAETNNKPETATILNKFCTQHSWLDKSFGLHKLKYITNKNDLFNYCPEGKILE